MKLEERRSSSYWRRKELLKEPTVPTMSEIRDNVGDILAEVIFEEANEVQKEYLGLDSPLEGPVGELWTSPSDLLIGKVCLKPPITQKHIQALTHQGILDIGIQIEQKYWNEMELEKQRAIQEEEARLKRMFEIEKEKLVQGLNKDLNAKHLQEIEEIRSFFENKINQLITECYIQVKQLEEEHEVEVNSLNVMWQEKLEETVKNTVDKLTEEFLEKMRLQEIVLVETFMKKINNLTLKHKCALEFDRIRSKEQTLQLRHNLECQNVANLMYLLCKERKKCKGEKEALQKYYKAKIRSCRGEIRAKAKKIRRLTLAKNKRQRQLETRERILIEILRQFRKFIYYALKASPTQGEFLLNIDKLLKFEVDDYCIQEEIIEKVPSPPKLFLEEIPELVDVNLYLAQQPPEEDEEFEESDVLPAFFFDENMYVREDFRDMFSAGMEIDRRHPLWNRDVEELLNIFRESMAEKQSNFFGGSASKIKSQQSSVHFDPDSLTNETAPLSVIAGEITESIENDETVTIVSESIATQLPQEIQCQKSSSIEVMEKEIRKVSMVDWPEAKAVAKEDKADKKGKKVKNARDRVSIATLPTSGSGAHAAPPPKVDSEDIKVKSDFASTQSKLTLARDSVILHISSIEKRSLHNISKVGLPEKESLKISSKEEDERKSTISPDEEELQQSYYPEGSEDIRSTESLEPESKTDSQLLKHTSRLVLAQDSLEIIRSTIGIVVKEKSISKEGGSPKKSSLVITKTGQVAKGKPKRKNLKLQQRKPTIHPGTSKKGASKPKAPTAKVAGSLKVQNYTTEVFTEERIKSLVKIMKDNPSLIHLFTGCSQ